MEVINGIRHKSFWLSLLLGLVLIIGGFGKTNSVFASINPQVIANQTDATIRGIDATDYLYYVSTYHKTYRDYAGNSLADVKAVMEFLKSSGVNTVSVKLAVHATKLPQANLNYAQNIIKAANEAGLKSNLVLLYSDEQTYANNQSLPSGWQQASSQSSADALLQTAKDYTNQTLATLKQNGATPTMVTLGNEVNYNFLGLTGTNNDDWNGWYDLAQLAACVKANDARTKVAIGVAAPNKPDDISWIVQALKSVNADYDMLGVNVYQSSSWISDVKTMQQVVVKASGKQFYVASAQFENQNTANTATLVTQSSDIYQMLNATVASDNAGGVIAADAMVTGGWHSFFDDDGTALKSLATFNTVMGKKTNTAADPYKEGNDPGLREQQVAVNKIATFKAGNIRGVDISSYQALKNAGVKFYDANGHQQSLLKVLHDNGVNYIRLRVWNDPKNSKGQYYGGGNNDVANDLKIAKEANKYGMKVLLDFQYSDTWADPATQIVPKAWQKDVNNPQKMQQDIYDFTYQTLQQFKQAQINVGMVQIGNEISRGMLGVTGSYNHVWVDSKTASVLCGYLNAGSAAVRKSNPTILIALHLESPDTQKYATVMDSWGKYGVDYDVLGTSYYPYWRKSNNNPNNLRAISLQAAKRNKLFVVLETAWANTLNDSDGTPNVVGAKSIEQIFKATPQGQVDELTSVYQTVTSQANGLGAFYWESAWIAVHAGWKNWQVNKAAAEKFGTGWISSYALGYYPNSKMYYQGKPAWGGSSWDNQGLFDNLGYPLQSLGFYRRAVSDQRNLQITKVNYVSKTNAKLAATQYVQTPLGQAVNIATPTIKGYQLVTKVTRQKADVAGVKIVQVVYAPITRPNKATKNVKRKAQKQPQAKKRQSKKVKCLAKPVYHHFGKYVVLAKNVNRVERALTGKKRSVKVTKRKWYAQGYWVVNRQIYYSLYSNKTKHHRWLGYVLASKTNIKKVNTKKVNHKKAKSKRLIAKNVKKRVYIYHKVAVYRDFNGHKRKVNVWRRRFLVKCYYQRSRKLAYYSIYSLNGKHWIGYINVAATRK